MKFIKSKPNQEHHAREILAVDSGEEGIKLVRFSFTERKPMIESVGFRSERLEDLVVKRSGRRLQLGKRYHSKNMALCISDENSIIRLLEVSSSGLRDDRIKERIGEKVNLGERYRLTHQVVREPHSTHKGELVVVGLRDQLISRVSQQFKNGVPSLVSIEAAGMAALRAFSWYLNQEMENRVVGFIEAGAHSLVFGIFAAGELVLLRTFDGGRDLLVRQVGDDLRLDEEQAKVIVADKGFDISESVTRAFKSFFTQLRVSRDYIERREDFHLEELYISGGLALSPYVVEAVANESGLKTTKWNPFDGLIVAPDAIPPELAGQEVRFAAAVGTGLSFWRDK